MARSRIALEGLPHSEIFGSKPVCGSPKLIAAYHVLHRRPAPRHPPYALSSLTTTSALLESVVVFSEATALYCRPLVAAFGGSNGACALAQAACWSRASRRGPRLKVRNARFCSCTPPVPYYALKRIFGCQ